MGDWAMENPNRCCRLSRCTMLTTGGSFFFALLSVSGCGGAPSEPPADSSAAGVVSGGTKPTGAVPRGPTVTAPPASSGNRRAEASEAPPSGHNLPASIPRLPIDRQPSMQKSDTGAFQRDARAQWYATARESPEVTVRLQALEQWAQQPNETLDPVTYALVDEDDTVRARAQTLYEQQLVREATAAAPLEQETKEP